jgi:hypothetical protein
MKRFFSITLILPCLFSFLPTLSDYKKLYSLKNIKKLSVGIAIAAIFANASLDKSLQRWYKDSLKNKYTDTLSRISKVFGEVWTPSVYICTHSVTKGCTRRWAKNTLKKIILAAPALLLLQRVIGGSRPLEGEPFWSPFKDSNGVSGHGFLGAIPFLEAAKMMQNSLFRCLFYVCSTFTALSRINDDAHYLSQAFLGWWLAYWVVFH